MRKNFLFAALTVLLAGFWFGGASLADNVAQVGDTGYDSLSDAIDAVDNENTTVTLLTGITLTESVIIDKSITLDFNSQTITGNSYKLVFSGNINVTITGNGIITANAQVMTIGNGSTTSESSPKVTIENGIFNGGDYGIFINGAASLTINNATVNSNGIGIFVYGPSASLIINGGLFQPTKFQFIFVHGATGKGGNKITVNSGTFIAADYVGIHAANNDEITLNGGEFTSGVGIVARAGKVKISKDVIFHPFGEGTCNVGDSPVKIIPCNKTVIMDVASNYQPGTEFTLENELGETYLIEGNDTSSYTGHSVKYGAEVENQTVNLTRDGTDAKINRPTTTPAGKVWINSGTSAEYDFDAVIASDVELVLNDLIETIDIAGIETPVDGATPATSFTTTTAGITLGTPIWSGDDDSEVTTFVAGSGYKLTIPFAVDDGYILTGGYTATANTGTVTTGASEITISGLTAMYKVTFDGANEVLAASGDSVANPGDPSKECNHFDGWYNGDEKVTFPLTVTGNLALVSKWTYTCSRSSGGGGSSRTSATTTDTKVDTAKADEQKADETKAEETKGNEDNGTNNGNDGAPAPESKYSQEMIDAYNWAFKNGITTMPTIEKADMEGKLTRIAMAKMLSFFAINVLGKTPDTDRVVPSFPDVDAQLDKDYDNGVTLAYQLGIMGIGIEEFRPNDEVTRGEFATALSRLLFNTPDGEGAFYEPHLAKLMEEKIITVDTPDLKELRGYVMIMLMRSAMEK